MSFHTSLSEKKQSQNSWTVIFKIGLFMGNQTESHFGVRFLLNVYHCKIELSLL